MKLKRLKYNKNQGSSANKLSDKGSRRGFDSEDDGQGSVDARTMLSSAHRPKIRQPGDAPKKIKILTGNISSKHIIRSDSTNKAAVSTSEKRPPSGTGPGVQSSEKLILKQTNINLSSDGKVKLLSSKTAKQRYDEHQQQ